MKSIASLFVIFVATIRCLCADAIDFGLVVHLKFDNDFTTGSLQSPDATGLTNLAQFPIDTPYTIGGNYATGSRGSGRIGSCFQQVDYGTEEYSAIVLANLGDPDDFPGYHIMSYCGITNIEHSGIARLTNGTISFWYYPVQTAAQNPSCSLVGAGLPGVSLDSASNSFSITAAHNESSSRIALTIFTNATSNPQFIAAEFPDLTINQWVFLTVVWNAAGNYVKLYVNGTLVATGTMNSAPFLQVAPMGGFQRRWIALLCNTHGEDLEVNPHGPNNGWSGDGARIDEFRVYTVSKNASEVSAIYNYTGEPKQITTFNGSVRFNGSVTFNK